MTIGFYLKIAGCLLVIAGASGWGSWLALNYRNRLEAAGAVKTDDVFAERTDSLCQCTVAGRI